MEEAAARGRPVAAWRSGWGNSRVTYAMRRLLSLAINAAALWVATRLVGGIGYTGSWLGLLGVALVFGAVNAFVRPVLALLAVPVQIVTLGLFTFVLNAAMLRLTGWFARALGIAFTVDGWWAAILGALVVGITSTLLSALLVDDDASE